MISRVHRALLAASAIIAATALLTLTAGSAVAKPICPPGTKVTKYCSVPIGPHLDGGVKETLNSNGSLTISFTLPAGTTVSFTLVQTSAGGKFTHGVRAHAAKSVKIPVKAKITKSGSVIHVKLLSKKGLKLTKGRYKLTLKLKRNGKKATVVKSFGLLK